MRRTLASLLLVVTMAGCGPAGGPLQAATDKLGDIRSGEMSLRLAAETTGGARTGFVISGPFSVPDDDSLPTADLTLRQLGAGAGPPVRFISTGRAAFVEAEGTAYRLPPEQVASLRGDTRASGRGPFDELELGSWVSDPEVTQGEVWDGVETERIRGELDVVAAANDLLTVTRDFGGVEVPQIEGEEADRLRGAVKSAALEVLMGAEDGLLRRLDIEVDLAASAPARLEPGLEDLLGVGFRLTLEIRNPNQPVRVDPPKAPLPAP